MTQELYLIDTRIFSDSRKFQDILPIYHSLWLSMETLLSIFSEAMRSDFDRLTDLISLTHDEIDTILGIGYRGTPTERLSSEVRMKMQKVIQIVQLLDMSYQSELFLGNIWKREEALRAWFRWLYPPLDSAIPPLDCIISDPERYLDRILELLNVEYILTAKAHPWVYRSEKYWSIINIL